MLEVQQSMGQSWGLEPGCMASVSKLFPWSHQLTLHGRVLVCVSSETLLLGSAPPRPPASGLQTGLLRSLGPADSQVRNGP